MYRNDVVFEVLEKIIHLTLIDRVNTNLRNHIASSCALEFAGLGWLILDSTQVPRRQSNESIRGGEELST